MVEYEFSKLGTRVRFPSPARMNKDRFVKIAGWLGVVFIILAYGLISLRLVNAGNFFYILLNILGSVGIIIEAGSKKDLQPVVLNIFWLAIAAISLYISFTR